VTVDDLLPFVSSLAIGLLVGFERGRSNRSEVRQAAGSRTFALLALSGTLAAAFDNWVIVAGLIAVGGLLVVGYRRTSADDPGATTELAALATFLLGALAWTETALAASLAIIVIVLLSAKGRIHSFARDVVTDAEVEDAVKFLVMAFVVLPSYRIATSAHTGCSTRSGSGNWSLRSPGFPGRATSPPEHSGRAAAF
jgi:hypothetical protein